jgi:predicted GNAT superfamily acetyltransferase
VVVTAWARGQGIARQIYQSIEQTAREQGMAIVADVYSEPPNTPSLNLHRSLGFQEVGTQHFPDHNKTASKLMKYIECAKTKAS